MEMQFTEQNLPALEARKILDGLQRLNLNPGDKVEVKCGDDKLIDTTVPAGKEWTIQIIVRIEETGI